MSLHDALPIEARSGFGRSEAEIEPRPQVRARLFPAMDLLVRRGMAGCRHDRMSDPGEDHQHGQDEDAALEKPTPLHLAVGAEDFAALFIAAIEGGAPSELPQGDVGDDLQHGTALRPDTPIGRASFREMESLSV